MAKSIDFGCTKCDRMFNSMVELQLHEKEHLKVSDKLPDQPVVTQVVKPITLNYVYKGNCPACQQAVTTLELDVDKKHFVTAVCTRCGKQHATREVVKL